MLKVTCAACVMPASDAPPSRSALLQQQEPFFGRVEGTTAVAATAVDYRFTTYAQRNGQATEETQKSVMS